MYDPIEEAARIMRTYQPKTLGDLYDLACKQVVRKDSSLSPSEDNYTTQYATDIVDAHYANLKNNDYREEAGLSRLEDMQ